MSGGDLEGFDGREEVDVQVQKHAAVHHAQAARDEIGGMGLTFLFFFFLNGMSVSP